MDNPGNVATENLNGSIDLDVDRRTSHCKRGISLRDYKESEDYRALKERFIIATQVVFGVIPREFQIKVALALHEGYDCQCVAATGAGKTLAYILPVLLNTNGVLIVISPLKSIMSDHASDKHPVVVFQELALMRFVDRRTGCATMVYGCLFSGMTPWI